MTRGKRFVAGLFAATVFAPAALLGPAPGIAAEGVTLIKDLDPAIGSAPGGFVEFRGRVFFSANAGPDGPSFWVTDGTARGTRQFGDTNPGGPDYGEPSTPFKGRLFFTAFDGTDSGIWVTGGSARRLRLFLPNPGDDIGISNLTRAGDRLFFMASDERGRELWATDGTRAGTGIVKDIDPSGDSSPTQFTAVGGKLFFTADPGDGPELWVSDGTETGTRAVLDINILEGSSPAYLTPVGDTLYFFADDAPPPIDNSELWRSDGTAAGTVQVAEINPAGGSTPPANPLDRGGDSQEFRFAALDDRLLFTAFDGVDAELWISDGTAAGTHEVADLEPGVLSSVPKLLTVAGGQVFFTASQGGSRGLWVSDGTAGGTVRLTEPDPYAILGELTAVADQLFLSFGLRGDAELWRSDGTIEGTRLFADISEQDYGSTPFNLANIDGTLFFTADDGIHGHELWRTNGLVGSCFEARLGLERAKRLDSGKPQIREARAAVRAACKH